MFSRTDLFPRFHEFLEPRAAMHLQKSFSTADMADSRSLFPPWTVSWQLENDAAFCTVPGHANDESDGESDDDGVEIKPHEEKRKKNAALKQAEIANNSKQEKQMRFLSQCVRAVNVCGLVFSLIPFYSWDLRQQEASG